MGGSGIERIKGTDKEGLLDVNRIDRCGDGNQPLETVTSGLLSWRYYFLPHDAMSVHSMLIRGGVQVRRLCTYIYIYFEGCDVNCRCVDVIRSTI